MSRFLGQLQSIGVVEEESGEVEFLGEVFGEGLAAEGFGGVAAGMEHVHAKFFREGKGPVGAFAGDEGVDSGFGGQGQFTAGATAF